MNLLLPSGAVVCVEEPRLRAVLLSGGSPAALIEAVWAHEMDSERLLPEDRTYLLGWCVEHLAQDPEAAAFEATYERSGRTASERLRITDPVLAYECDFQFKTALARARAQADDRANEPEESAEDSVRFTTPER